MNIVESDCVFNKLIQDFDKYSSYSEAVLQCECILKADTNRRNSRSERKTFTRVFHHCQIKGHKSDECKFKRRGLPVGNYNKMKEREVKKEDINNVVKSNEKKQSDNLLLVDVKVNDKKIKALLDTGATKSIICNKVARDLNMKIDKNKSLNIATLGERNLKMWKSQKSVNIKFKGYSFTKYILISDNEFSLDREYQLIIGNDILKDTPHFNELKKLSYENDDKIIINVINKSSQIPYNNGKKRTKEGSETCHILSSIKENFETEKRGRKKKKNIEAENQISERETEINENDYTPLYELTLEHIKSKQMEDPKLDDEEFIKQLKLVCIDGTWGIKDKTSFKAYLPEELSETIIKVMHEQGHYGKDRLLRTISQRYCSENFILIVNRICKNCELCQLYVPIRKKSNYQSTITADYPNQVWAMDLTGAFMWKGSKQATIVSLDVFSKFLIAEIVENDIENIKILSSFMYRYGKPNTSIKSYFETIGICHRTTTPYCHGYRYDEIYIRILEETMAKLRNDLRGNDLRQTLEIATYYINRAVQVNGYSAFEIFICQPKENLETDLINHEYKVLDEIDEYLATRQIVYSIIYSTNLLTKLKAKDGQTYKENSYRPGDLIIVKKGQREGDKWELRNEGPYKVEKVDQFHVMYRKGNRRKMFKTHFSDVKKIPETEL
uniref:RNA-directed DNA polymerase n=1 Tax=Strongyloides venezuelensis TaxID=75913 RepID=A0A0K0FDR4_STRVS